MTTVFPSPTAESVLPHVTRELRTTQAIFNAWTQAVGAERMLSRYGEVELRREVFAALSDLDSAGKVRMVRINSRRCEWRLP